MNPKRVQILKEGKEFRGPVIYWMQRDQRVKDNWALIYAQEQAIKRNVPLYVVFTLVNKFLGATIRQYGFMLKGLEEVESRLHDLNIPFFVLTGNPVELIPELVRTSKSGLLTSDFNPLRNIRKWKSDVVKRIDIPFHIVDAHNIVPCWIASNKEEFAAYTLRPKIHRLLDEFLDSFPGLKKMNSPFSKFIYTDWNTLREKLEIDFNVQEVNWITPGEKAAHTMLRKFVNKKISNYAEQRNNPNLDAQSNLSPYLHFGQIAAQRVALNIQPLIQYSESQKAFLEELIVRRELADNFCYYNPNYDSFNGFQNWAKVSLDKHRSDKREHLYKRKEFENGKTNDILWNAAQLEMVNTGKMHGYMRMYWAKKILEWTESPEDSMKIAIYLNDKYQLDGRDANGYTGISWSIGGIHDRAWKEQNIFGKIRYMNFNGCKRKFDVFKYVEKYLNTSNISLNYK